MNEYAFGNNLRMALDNAGMSAMELAARIGVHKNTIYGWMNAKQAMPAIRLYQICQVLGVSMDDLMRGTDEE